MTWMKSFAGLRILWKNLITILLHKKYVYQVQHEYVSIDIILQSFAWFLEAKNSSERKGLWYLNIQNEDMEREKGIYNYLLVNVTCCVCLYFENTLCIYILLYIPWWYFGGMFIINVTFVNLTLSWGIPGYHKLITNKPQIVPFQILSQKHQNS